MMNARGIARLGILAVGLGIGAAVASTPGVASADSSTDWWSSIDSLLTAGALPVVPSTLDYQISIDGTDLFPTAGNSATAVSGTGDIAIAFGIGANATAEGGFGDYALADASTGGIGASAVAGDTAAGATGNNFDFASATGNGSEALSGNELGTPDTTGSSFDFASASGGNGGIDGPDEAIAGQNGSGDIASAVGQNVSSVSGFSKDAADPNNFDFASATGNNTTPTTDLTEALAGGNTEGVGGSSYDIATVYDPSGTVGSDAIVGANLTTAGDYDLASVFGDALHATTATGANFLVDILPSL
jgi:hypothetical protein